MADRISREARAELLTVVRDRYRRATKQGKARILDELTVWTRCHRKSVIRLLHFDGEPRMKASRVDRRVYDEAVREALTVLWEAADRICGKRLKCLLPTLLEAMEKHGHLQLDPSVRSRLLAISPATIDRLLASVRAQSHSRRKRRRVKKATKLVAVRTFADWTDLPPGHLEIDFVVHCGGEIAGAYIHSLVATDVESGWTEAAPLLVREQSLVTEGLTMLRRQFPMPVLGINSDNDSAFINETVESYCAQEGITFTRSRAYHKNDQAWIEQKNGAVIRRLVGYDRFSGVVAAQAMAQLYQAARLYGNYFQPSFKLRGKSREGARVRRSYHPPATPCDRLLSQALISESVKSRLRHEGARLDPVELLHRIRQAQAALASLGSRTDQHAPNEDLAKFLQGLSTLYKSGEARPTHRKELAGPRHYRTRKDPFVNVWREVLVWLQQSPGATAKDLFQRLVRTYPGEFQDGQLRTLQRRIRQWRKTMARTLISVEVKKSPRLLSERRNPDHPLAHEPTQNGTGSFSISPASATMERVSRTLS